MRGGGGVGGGVLVVVVLGDKAIQSTLSNPTGHGRTSEGLCDTVLRMQIKLS